MLDANVLVDAQLRDIFLILAERELIEVRWSTGLLAELRDVLVDRMNRSPQAVDRLCAAIREAFPASEVVVDGVMSQLTAPDPDDVHVLAAAVAGEADVLVTQDRHGFPAEETLAAWDLAIMSPAAALEELIMSLGIVTVAQAFDDATRALKNPPLDILDQLRRLEATAPLAAVAIGATLDLPGYRDLMMDAIAAGSPDNPRTAVTALLDCLRLDDESGADALLSPTAKASLASTSRRRARLLRQTLGDVLRTADEWAFGSAHRPISVDTEIVKLVHVGTAGRVVHQPTLVRAHLFECVLIEGQWLVNAIDIPDSDVDGLADQQPG